MLFNSWGYALFFPIVFVVYWLLLGKTHQWQNRFLLAASYLFYGSWDYRFLFLLIFSTALDFFTGLKIYEASTKRSKYIWLIISVGINLGFLGFFKYYNFFIDSFANLLQLANVSVHYTTLQIILPVGISFYTFHGLSYVFDIYNNKKKPTTNFVNYSLFVSFFPLLIAGPIERATHLLPQVESKRTFEYNKVVDGLKQILWGLFKKIVIADNCAAYANDVFANYQQYNGITLFLGAVMFAIQIYADFSAYSDIALGSARMLGMELLRNFSYPYFSRDIAEFWRRWHISLSTWFRDYLYFPLGGSRGSKWLTIRNTFIIFLVSGFWHGANYTFIVWGLLHALYFLPLLLTNSNRNNLEIVAAKSKLPSLKELLGIVTTFILVVFAWIFFRANNLTEAINFIQRIFGEFTLSLPYKMPFITLSLVIFFFIIEWLGRRNIYPIQSLFQSYKTVYRYSFYYALLLLIFFFAGKEQTFIYFQF